MFHLDAARCYNTRWYTEASQNPCGEAVERIEMLLNQAPGVEMLLNQHPV
jgi:hypothetical protein